MFIVALFRAAKTWKQLNWPLVGKWTNKLWYIQTVEYVLALKRNQAIERHEGVLNAYY